MKYLLFLFLALCFTCGLFALEDLIIGAGPELNGHTREGMALGGGLSAGVDLNRSFGLGLKSSFVHNLDTVGTFEPLVFFRYYLPLRINGPFVQAEAGGVFAFENGGTYPAFAAGLGAGWRFLFGKKSGVISNWHIEPSLRFGYPHVWGISVRAVLSLSVFSKPRAAQKIEEQEVMQAMEELNELDIFFRSNSADFEGLDEEILAANAQALDHITQTLNRFMGYRLVVEGHANPLTPEGPGREAEEPELKKLSEERAQRIAEELVSRGIARDRIQTIGVGSSGSAVSFDDSENVWRNRRVLFILLK